MCKLSTSVWCCDDVILILVRESIILLKWLKFVKIV